MQSLLLLTALVALPCQLQVVLEVKVITLSEDCFERIGVDFSNATPDPLGDVKFHTFIEAVQGDRRTTIQQAPKVTALDGQLTTIHIGDSASYLHLETRPVISADRQSVKLHFKMEHQEAAEVKRTTVEKTMTIPDGQTMLLTGPKRMVETCNEFNPPVLSKIPYVNRLFKNVGYGREMQSLLITITPRIIHNCDEEVKTASHEQPVSKRAEAIAELLQAYEQACARGQTDEASTLARAALLLDPYCFSKTATRSTTSRTSRPTPPAPFRAASSSP